ncbi:MAG: hypothetical protein SVR08_16730 [Spirochaetota bacterium]|nr:hypothetical protein [Spirochaetota bacterium]
MAQTKKTTKQVNFDEYKAIKDDIIEISEQRFENRLLQLGKNINKNIDQKIESFKNETRWLIGLSLVILTTLITVFKFID